jgi:HSP20 family protein
MASKQELQVQQKRELEKKQESTIPARVFLPTADIYEDEDALSVVLEMPGVDKENVEVSIEDGLQGWRTAGFLEVSRPATALYRVQHW